MHCMLAKKLCLGIAEDRDIFFRPMESFLLLAIDEDLEVKNRILSVIFHIKKYSESHRLGSICHPGILSGDLNALKIVVYGRD